MGETEAERELREAKAAWAGTWLLYEQADLALRQARETERVAAERLGRAETDYILHTKGV